MMEETTAGLKEVPEPSPRPSIDERRLWIGNLDPRVTEYQLLKLLQKYGAIEKFDLLFHRTGALAGQPRGYAFVTYVNQQHANLAKGQLHNKQIGTKNVAVTWAHSISNEEPVKPKSEIVIPALAMSKLENKVNRESQIEAIEAKLKLMERKKDVQELEINKTVATEPPIISLFQGKKPESCTSNFSIKNKYSSKRGDKRRAPYHKQYSRK